MGKTRKGEAIRPQRRTAAEVRRLRALLEEAERSKDLGAWRRATAVLGYLEGRAAIAMSAELKVDRSAIAKWIGWYNAQGADGLRSRTAPGRPPRLTEAQRRVLIRIVTAGPETAGFASGVWTGPMIGEWIRREFGVGYHPQHIPRLLHQLGFSLQRPRKRLGQAVLADQAKWLRHTFQRIKKKRPPVAAS
jgi:transposase